MTQFPTAAHPYVVQNTTAPAYWYLGLLWAMLATGEQTAGSYSLMEEWCPKNSGPPPHYHEQDEAFYVIEGTITYLANGQELQATTGGFVSVPKRTVHSFRVDSETAHILNFYAPAGFENIILQLAEPAPMRTMPPMGYQDTQLDSHNVLNVFEQYGMHMVDEPDVLRQNKI
jgi:quercetin dioxygenase-like cupin family protein